jgi:hypothetical protein
MSLRKYNYVARINPQKTRPKPLHFIKNYARFCLNRTDVALLLNKKKELEFFHKMQVGDEYFLSILYPLKNWKDFAVTYDDWEYIEKEKKRIKNEKRILYEIQEKKGINKSKELEELEEKFRMIAKSPKTIVNVEEDLEKLKECSSYFYRKFAKDSNIEKYWKEIIKYHEKK